MSDTSFKLQQEIMPALRAGDLALCQRTIAERLVALPRSPFHVVLELDITNDLKAVAAYFNIFFRQQPHGLIAAAYTEMNGFDINSNL